MKKSAVFLFILFFISNVPLFAQDLTGTWVCAGAYKAEWFQEGQHVYSIYNVGHLKHYLSGRFVSANQIEAQVVRIDVNNGCRTTLTFRYTVTDNTLTGSWTANDGNCDLQRGQTGDETITRTTATPRPLNTFGGTAFNPANDVTGSWSWEDDWLQDGQNVYYIANGNGYKQFFRGTRNGNQIRGELIRFNPSGCRMILKQTFTQADANTMQYNWIGMGNCDITNGQTESGTIVRKNGAAGGNLYSGINITLSNLIVTNATVYPSENFQGTSVNIINTNGIQTLSQLGISAVRSIKVAWGQKAIITYGNNSRMEIIGDREGGLPTNISTIEIVTYAPLNGWVDMHTHPMSHLGWGGKLFHGAPDIDILVPAQDNCQQYQRAANINQALCSCKGAHGGWDLFNNNCGDEIRKGLLRIVENGMSEASVRNGGPPIQTAHHEEGARGFPAFQGWPAYNNFTHQQMWIEWIKRAYEGGLRIMVALTVNNATYAAAFSGPGDRNPDDVSSSDIQIQEMVRLVNRHNGSPGSVDDWMEIARTPQDIRRIIGANKLAIILGIEVDNIGNFHKNPQINPNVLTTESRNLVANEIERLYRQGIRYVFPVHVVDNKFGGTAIYEDAFNFSNYHQNGNFFDIICGEQGDDITKPYKHFDPKLGLAGAKIGVDIARRPPPLPNCNTGTGHKNRLGLTPLGEFAIKEMMKKGMIIDLDHMSDRAIERTLWLGQQFNYPINSGHSGIRSGGSASERSLKVSQYQRIANLGGLAGMGTDGALPESFRDGFNQLVQVMDYKGVAVGTDANGFAKLPRPPGVIGITYDTSFPMSKTGDRTWNYNNEGVAHYGLMSDFFRDVKGIDQAGARAIAHLNRSCEFFAQMWEKCERRKNAVR